MGRYVVQHNYRSFSDGEWLGPWVKGDEVELDDARAEHVERDSPGALKPAAARKAKPAAKTPAKAPAKPAAKVADAKTDGGA
jgi:hypothetical protein